ncbi:MAG: terpene cyclase/mutase family protein [Planctomycetales bacterium]|nr:terpene cyclase/mutase family protein [Planctomycetales bacterium]
MSPRLAWLLCIGSTCAAWLVLGLHADAQPLASPPAGAGPPPASKDILSEREWRQLESAAARGLAWLSAQQDADGSFPTDPYGQPGVTSLCVLAYLSHGHLPEEGPHGKRLADALRYIVRQQKPSGLIASYGPQGAYLNRNLRGDVGSTAAYNHAISGLAISEAYGVSPSEKLEQAIRLGLKTTLTMQSWPKRRPDFGGWRYLNQHDEYDSDLSVTGWQLMFLRSAKNAGFEVRQEPIDNAVDYVRRCFDRDFGVFEYEVSGRDRRSRGMAGAGILALAHAGMHNSPEAQKSGDWILEHPFDKYNEFIEFSADNRHKDRYHYGLFNCSQAMYQLGGRHWEQFYPTAVRVLLANQRPDGSWPIDSNGLDGKYGACYSTSLAVLTLAAPNQLLPIFQR